MRVIIEMFVNSSVNPETLKGGQRFMDINPECITMGKRNRGTFTCDRKCKEPDEWEKWMQVFKKKEKEKRKISFTGHTDIVSYIQEKIFCELGVDGQCATRKCLLMSLALSFSLTF